MSVPDAVQPDHGHARLRAQLREPVRVRLRTHGAPSLVHDDIAGVFRTPVHAHHLAASQAAQRQPPPSRPVVRIRSLAEPQQVRGLPHLGLLGVAVLLARRLDSDRGVGHEDSLGDPICEYLSHRSEREHDGPSARATSALPAVGREPGHQRLDITAGLGPASGPARADGLQHLLVAQSGHSRTSRRGVSHTQPGGRSPGRPAPPWIPTLSRHAVLA
jgi:hypothetical protein